MHYLDLQLCAYALPQKMNNILKYGKEVSMKYLVISDIHGNIEYARKIEDLIKIENPDKLILLGDLYYHGPKGYNDNYDYQTVVDILNKYKKIILCTFGNCDTREDEKASEFELKESIILKINGKYFYFSHGNRYNKDNEPDCLFDVLIYGHLHIGFIEKENGKIYANPGSISSPRYGSVNSYIIINDYDIILKDIDGNTLNNIRYV